MKFTDAEINFIDESNALLTLIEKSIFDLELRRNALTGRYKKCDLCNDLFLTKNTLAIYCSNACKSKSWRLRKKPNQ